MLRADYHIHCKNSPDSSEPLERICESAVRAGLEEIMVTDHYELFTDAFGREPFQEAYLERCLRTVLECRARYGDRLYVGLGIELGQWQLQPAAAARIVEGYPFDYVIASYHKMADVDLGKLNYKELNTKKLCHSYLEGLLEIAEEGDFDCLGHIDLIKRYAAAQGIRIRIEEEEKLVRAVLRTLVRREKGLEVNTSGLRQAVGEPFPSERVLAWYREEGGRILTVGSDAHRALDVAAGLADAERLIKKIGFDRIASFRGRRLELIKL